MLNWLAQNLCLGPLYALCWLAVAALSYNSFTASTSASQSASRPEGPALYTFLQMIMLLFYGVMCT